MNGLFFSLDTSAIARLGNQISAAGAKAPLALARAINHTGGKAKTQMVRELTKQTGLKRGVIFRALKPMNASAGSLTYTITSRGGNVSLKYFGARETRPGVSAAPWNRRQVYFGAFMKAGWWPKRVSKGNWHGQVFRRTGGVTKNARDGSSRKMDKFEKVRSGLFIPHEMVTGATAAAFHREVEASLPGRLSHELGRVLGG